MTTAAQTRPPASAAPAPASSATGSRPASTSRATTARGSASTPVEASPLQTLRSKPPEAGSLAAFAANTRAAHDSVSGLSPLNGDPDSLITSLVGTAAGHL